ncbi:hypothetical protein BH11PSE7_BH11PSE7_07290 [soil metagenome]
MTSPKTIKRIDNLIWALIFGGMFIIVFALLLRQGGVSFHWPIAAFGAVLTVTGAVLIWVRSRLTQDS